ncbi:MAG TPA: tetratricopeptide repeat protein [Pyrinomonadaceae bacterium]
MRLRPLIGWGVFFLLIAIIANFVPSGLGSFYFIKGRRLSSSGDHQAAIQAYQRSINSDPKFARTYVELGTSYLALEKYSEAEAAFKQATALDDDSCASCGLGMVYHRQGREDEAVKTLKKAINLNPKDTCPYDQLGRMYYDLGQYTESIDAFRQEIKVQPSAVAYHFLGNGYYFTEKLEDAVAAYREAIRLKPDYEVAYIELGKVYNRLGRHADAIDSYQQALKIQPKDVIAHVGLGLTEFKQGNKDAAIRQYRILRDLDPNWAERLLREINAQQSYEQTH